jgi:hypothetical protein
VRYIVRSFRPCCCALSLFPLHPCCNHRAIHRATVVQPVIPRISENIQIRHLPGSYVIIGESADTRKTHASRERFRAGQMLMIRNLSFAIQYTTREHCDD